MGNAYPTFGDDRIIVGHFSASNPGMELPKHWEPLFFDSISKHTIYKIYNDNNKLSIKAESNASASGLIRKIKIDPEKYPILKWQWKVTGVLKNGDVKKKSGDDYPARIYISFEYDSDKVGLLDKAKYSALKLLHGEYPPIGAINYIWESNAPKGSIVPNAYTDRVRMIVVESGTKHLNVWKEEERNIYEDYLTAFGETPPPISGVAIMTDTDNTGESAVSYYGDIWFESVNK
jgi:hypothetical protein